MNIKRTSNVRDIRDTLLSLAYALEHEPDTVYGLCVLTKTRLSEQRMHGELEQFRSVVRQRIAERIFLAGLNEDGEGFVGDLPPASRSLLSFINETIQAEQSSVRVSRQTVKAYLLDCWLAGLGPQTINSLTRATGASPPTVAAALEDLREVGAVNEDQARGAMLREPHWESWRRLAELQSGNRKITRFIDPSGEGRRPLDLARRLQDLRQKGLAEAVETGGVVGAQAYYPDLDISAPPRLDLCIYDENKRFVRSLDAALVESSDPRMKPAVVLHLTPLLRSVPPEFRREQHAASPLDCVADLLEMGYQAEARDFALALTRQTRKHSRLT